MPDREPMSKIVRPLRSGQITIPAEFRKRLGIQEDTLLRLTLAGDEIHLKPVQQADTAAGSPWLKDLYDLFAPVRQEAEDKGYTDEEINATIDEAVKQVRPKHARRL